MILRLCLMYQPEPVITENRHYSNLRCKVKEMCEMLSDLRVVFYHVYVKL